MATPQPRPQSFLRLRGKSFMSVVLTPELPLAGWVAQLDDQIARSPKVFEGRPVLLDVSLLAGAEREIAGLVQALAERSVRVIGLDGTAPHALGGLEAELPPLMAGGRNAALIGEEPRPAPGTAPGAAPAAAMPAASGPARSENTTLVLEHSIRSGQSVSHPGGDVVVIGSVASGSEVVAGGSVHVYGTLRGRAIAGLLGAGPNGSRPRIFCSRLDAELLAIDGVYKTADEIGRTLAGHPAQAWLHGEELRVAGLD